MRSILIPFVAFLSLFATHPTPYQRMVEKVEKSVTFIKGTTFEGGETHHYTCTGFQVTKDLVMTADHCIGDIMTVDGIAAHPAKEDEDADLALVVAKTGRPPLGFSSHEPQRFEHLTAIGHAFGERQNTVLSEVAFIISGGSTLVQGGYIGGMSGGPVVNDDGAVVSIVQGYIQEYPQIGIGASESVILTFLGLK